MKIAFRKSVLCLQVVVLLAVMAISTQLASATQWWVYASAAAGGDGSSAHPFQTIDAGIAAATSGDTVTVKHGTYHEAATLNLKSGVTLQANGTDQVIVTGMGDLTPAGGTSWTTYTGTTSVPAGTTVYTATVPWVVRDLYNTYTRNPISRTPPSYAAWASISAYDSTSHTITLTAPLGVTFSSTLSSFVYIYEKGTLNSYLTYYISSLTNNGQTITITIPASDKSSQYIAAGDLLLVCNHPSLIRGSGDWAYQDNGDGTTTLVWDPGSSTNLNYAQSNKTSVVLKAANLTNVTIKGLEVTGGQAEGIYCLKDSGVTIQNCLVHDNGSGGAFGTPGIFVDTCTNAIVENCIVAANWVGIGSASCNGFTLKQSEVAFNDSDGIDISGRLDSSGNVIPSEEETNVTIQQNYLHNHVAMLHPDNLQFYNGVADVTIDSNFFNVSGQSIMSQAIDGVTVTNNVFMASGARNVILGHGSSADWAFNNNTFAFGFYGATSADTPGTTGTYTLLNTIFYRDILSFTGETSSDYSLYWDGADQIANTSPPFVSYYTNPTGSQKGIPDITLYNSSYDAHSTGGNPLFTNMPIAQAQVSSGLSSSTTSQLVLDAPGASHLTGLFNVGDVVEVDGDGVVRTITAVSNVSAAHTTITISPVLSSRPFRSLLVWDWPAGTTNLTIDARPATGSPALTGSSTGGQRGSAINTAQYVAGSFDGTGTRNIPTLPSTMGHVFSVNGYTGYPYSGPNP